MLGVDGVKRGEMFVRYRVDVGVLPITYLTGTVTLTGCSVDSNGRSAQKVLWTE